VLTGCTAAFVRLAAAGNLLPGTSRHVKFVLSLRNSTKPSASEGAAPKAGQLLGQQGGCPTVGAGQFTLCRSAQIMLLQNKCVILALT